MTWKLQGAFHQPSNYQTFYNPLQKDGWDVHVPLLPTCNNALPMDVRSYNNDKTVIRNLVESLVQKGRYPIVVMHSYGGAPGSDALKGLSARERASVGDSGGVIHLIFVCAYLFQVGESATSLIERFNPELMKDPGEINYVYDNGTMKPKNPAQTMYNALPPGDARVKKSIDLLEPFAAAAFYAQTTYTAWSNIHTTYMNTSDDLALPGKYQDFMLEQAQGKTNMAFDTKYVGKGHSPFLTNPSIIINYVEFLWRMFSVH